MIIGAESGRDVEWKTIAHGSCNADFQSAVSQNLRSACFRQLQRAAIDPKISLSLDLRSLLKDSVESANLTDGICIVEH